MSKIKGTCWCGASTLRAEGPGKFGIICHCSDCRKASGAGGLPQLAVEASNVTVEGPVTTFETKADSGNTLTFRFCATCGSSLAKTTEAAPALTFLAIGALDPGTEVPPLRRVFEEGRQSWDV